MVDIQFLDAEQIVEIHGILLDKWGGNGGGGHRGASYEGVEAAVQAVKNSYYDTLEELAAAYAVYIVQGHVFLDGNKRSGAAALTVFLVGNGLNPKIQPALLAQYMVELQQRAEAGERTDALVAWLAEQI